MVKTILVKKGRIELPEESVLSKEKRRIVIKFPYTVQIERLDKNDFTVTTQQWFRQKGKDKPYIPEGFVEIDGEIYKVEEPEVEDD